MRGNIRKRGSTYQIRINLGVDSCTNKRKEISKSGFKTKKEAEKALNELIMQLESGNYIEDKKLLLKDFLELWLKSIESTVSPNTLWFYQDITNRILINKLGNHQLSKLNALAIQNFVNSYNGIVSSTTARHYYNILNIALNYAAQVLKIIPLNPCINVKPPQPKEAKMQVLNHEQVNIVLEYVKTSEFKVMYIPIVLAITCGLRRGEAAALMWSDVDLDNGIIRIVNNRVRVGKETILTTPKSDNSKRSIDLLPSTIPILNQLKLAQEWNKRILGDEYQDNGYVCCWEDGRPLRPDYITSTWTKILKKCNLPLMRFHDLRHTHATLLLQADVNPKIVSERLGHKEVGITLNTYSHVLPSMQKEAAEKLDNKLFKVL